MHSISSTSQLGAKRMDDLVGGLQIATKKYDVGLFICFLADGESFSWNPKNWVKSNRSNICETL